MINVKYLVIDIFFLWQDISYLISQDKCKILTYFFVIGYPERCLWKYNDKFILPPFMRYNSTLLSQCILGVAFNFDLSMSLFLYNINVCS